MDTQSGVSRFRPPRIRVHPTWYIAAALITGILVTQYPGDQALWQRAALGLAGSLVLFFSMAVAAALGTGLAMLARVPVRNITVFVFGGVAVVPADSTSPGREAGTAIATLLLNFAVAGLFNWIYVGQTRGAESVFVPMLQWLAFFWYMLAIMHVVPAFPLSGGRILSAAIWKSTGDHLRAAQWSGRIGLVAGLAIGVLGVARLFGTSGQTTSGLMLLFMGASVGGGAITTVRRAALLHALEHTTARNIMAAEFPTIGPSVTLIEVVRDRVLVNGQDYFAVVDGGALLGIVTIRDIAHVPRGRWNSTQAKMIMRSARRFASVTGEQSAAGVLEEMDSRRVDRIPVLEGRVMVGIVSREGILRLASARARLRV